MPTLSPIGTHLFRPSLGRFALCGLWFAHLERAGDQSNETRQFGKELEDGLIHLVNNNPTLRLPLEDRHSTDIDLACLFLYRRGRVDAIGAWVHEIVTACALATFQNARYPRCLREYDGLLAYPGNEKGYREHATRGSILYPTLAFWAWRCGQAPILQLLSDLIEHRYGHTTLQLWFPGHDSEPSWYLDDESHGYALTDITIDGSGDALAARVAEELASATPLTYMSAVRLDLWPLLLVACRHYRHPVPPQFWPLEVGREVDGDDSLAKSESTDTA